MLRFIEHPIFSKQVEALLTVDEYKDFQREIADNPAKGDVIPGLAGLRKVRVRYGQKGKRGGARTIYLLMPRPGIVFLFYMYSKGDIQDMDSDQKKRLKNAVEDIKREFER